MTDHTISTTTVAGYALWLLGAGFVALSFFGPLPLAAIGLLLAGAGGVMQIRGFLCAQERQHRNAFELGRESVRSLR